MPVPKTRDVGKVMRHLKKHKPSMPQKQKVAIALDTARRAGASVKTKISDTARKAFRY